MYRIQERILVTDIPERFVIPCFDGIDSELPRGALVNAKGWCLSYGTVNRTHNITDESILGQIANR
jgi:hypothetical protein